MKRSIDDTTEETTKRRLANNPEDNSNYSFNNQSSTRLEDLSNEIFHEVCDYLDPLHMYQAFVGLNERFSDFLMSPTLSFKLNLTSLSKSDFQDYAAHFIPLHQHQVISLRMRNFFSYDLDVSPHRLLPTFPRLKTLILEHMHSKYVDSVLNGIAGLPSLSTLVLDIDEYVQDGSELLLRVFHLPMLKYCQLNFTEIVRTQALPFASDAHSCIEQLVLKHLVYFHQLDRILSYVPQLRRLSLNFPVKAHIQYEFHPSLSLKNFTHLFLKLGSVGFDDFGLLMKSFFSTVEVLHISTSNDDTYLEAHRWEQLIKSSLPRLRIFDLHANGRSHTTDESQLTHFSSPFWTKRQWYFAHENCSIGNSARRTNLFSVSPYRRQEYLIHWPLTLPPYPDDQAKRLNAVRRLHIFNRQPLTDYAYHFPRATHLTLGYHDFSQSSSHVLDLQGVVPLQNLTSLQLTTSQILWEELIEILLWTPNLTTLAAIFRTDCPTKLRAIRESTNFQSVAHRNIIREFTTGCVIHLEEAELITQLFSRLESFTVESFTRRSASLIRALFSENSKLVPYLHSVSMAVDDVRYLKRVGNLTQERQFLAGASFKTEYRRLRLWR